MYRDTALIKKNATRVRLDDYLDNQVESVCNLTGEQKAVVMRKLIEIGLANFHGVEFNSASKCVEGSVAAS